jgi:putative PEP-CTERM system TPR-repeat lipoprotein
MKLRSTRTGLAMLAVVSAISLISLVTPAIAALPPASGGSAKAAVAQLVSDAQKAIKAGKLPLAVIDLRNASSADPRNGQVRGQLGALLQQTGDYYAAERELRQARKDGASDQIILPFLFQTMLARGEEKALLDEFPEPSAPSAIAPDILKGRAMAFMNLSQWDDATSAMDKSLKQRRDAPGLLLRARIAEKAGLLPAAVQFTDEAIAMDPTKINGSLFKVGLLLDLNNSNDALALVDQLVVKFPTNLPAQFSRIEVLLRMNRNDQAKAAVNTILAKDPGIAIGIYYRALLIGRSGNSKDAWRIAQSLPQEFVRSQPGIALTVAKMAETAGSSETAASILSGAVGRYPQDSQLRIQVAEMRVRQNDMVGALNALEPLRENLDPAAAQTLAAIYARSSRASDALGILEKLVQSGKASDASILQLVALEMQMAQPDQALKDLTAAVNQKPNDPVLAGQLISVLSARGRYADALTVSDKLGADPAQRVTALVFRGQIFLGEQKLDDALASYAKAMQTDPKSQVALFGHANVLEAMQRYDDAVNDLHAILVLNPQSIVTHQKLAEIAARRNQDGQVRSILAQAIKLSPQDPAPRMSLARYLLLRNDKAGALQTINDLLKVRPENAEAVALLGGVQLAMKKNADAVTSFRRIVTLRPYVPQSQIYLGGALLANGDRAGANAALKNAVNMATDSAEVRLAQINMFLAQKDINGAIASAQAFKDANPGPQGDLLLGDTLARTGQRDRAIAVYKKSLETHPNGNAVLRIASYSIAAKDSKTAVETLSGWIDKNPDDVPVRLQYGMLLMQQGSNADADKQFREILKRQPNNVVCLNDLAWLIRDQNPSEATAMASRAATLAPGSSDVLDTLGWIKLKHGKAADSLPLFQRAHALRPRDGEISYHLALGLEATGKHAAARGFLKALLASQVKFVDLAEANKLAQNWH